MNAQPQPRHRGAMRVAGIALRTDNASEANPAAGKIPGLWQRFRSEDWFGRLEQAGAFGPPIGVYSAYESDASGSFQILAGREVTAASHVTPPLQLVSIPAGTYLVFHSGGRLPDSVIRGWQEVWTFFDRSDAPARAYTCDIEIYPNAETVEIWVAIED